MPKIIQPWKGLITGWSGNMGSEKTSRLILQARDSRKHRAGVTVFQPVEAVRDESKPDEITSRSSLVYKGVVTYKHPDEILENLHARKVKHVFFDEVQFNDTSSTRREAFKRVIRHLLATDEYHVYWAGLPRDFLGETFETVGWLIGITAPNNNELDSECDVCGRVPAPLPQRLLKGKPVSRDDPRFITEKKENEDKGISYEARCTSCHQIAE